MRYTAALFATLVLAACSKARDTRNDSPPVSPAIEEFLLASAATDFHAHRPPDPVHFRDVHIGHAKTSSGEEQYMLCGRFVSGQQAAGAQGTPFVTLKTSGYEQYVGPQAAARYCQPPSVIWDKGDLSTSLQNRFDSLNSVGH